jgi:hypothetical protein
MAENKVILTWSILVSCRAHTTTFVIVLGGGYAILRHTVADSQLDLQPLLAVSHCLPVSVQVWQ